MEGTDRARKARTLRTDIHSPLCAQSRVGLVQNGGEVGDSCHAPFRLGSDEDDRLYGALLRNLRVSDGWAAAHGAFHLALVSACDSPWLLRLRALLYAQSERYRRLSVPAALRAHNLDAEHRGLTDAALAHDVLREAVQVVFEGSRKCA